MGILNEHASGPAPFQVMAKPTGPLCNLDCTYCFYLEKEKLYPGTKNWAMREDVLETYIRQYIESQPQPIVSFAWQGGEPTLLGIPWFENVLALQKEYAQGKPIEIYEFLKDIGSGFMQFIPVVERRVSQPSPEGLVLLGPEQNSAQVTDWSVEPTIFGDFLCAMFDVWVRNDVGKRFVQLFDVTLELWLGLQPSLCVFAETCGNALAVEHQGDLYSCDHYVYPQNKLGNILDDPLASLFKTKKQQDFGAAKRDSLPALCRECDVRFACNGECPKHRFMTTPDGEPGLNYLCAAYKKFFHHVAPYMEFMGRELLNQRSPARVMEYARWVDAELNHREAESKS